MSPAKLRWGLLFIAVGILILATNAGWLSDYYWLELLEWWPLLLIALGIEKIFQKTGARVISYLSPVALILFMFYLAIDIGDRDPSHNYFSRMRWDREMDSSVKMIEANIDHGDYDIRVSRTPDMLAEIRAERYTRKPDIDYEKRDSIGILNIDHGMSAGSIIYFHNGRMRDDWTIEFSELVPVKLNCMGRDSDVNLLMSRIPLKEITLENEEGDIYLKIGDLQPEVRIHIKGEDSRLILRVPANSGLRAEGGTYAGYFEEIGMTGVDEYFYSPGYDTAMIKVDLEIADQLRHLSIEYY